VDPDVHARPRDRDREHEEGGQTAAEEVAEHDRAGEARRRVARREGPGDGAADERVDALEVLEGARAVAGELDGEREKVGAPDARGRERRRREERLLGEHGEDRREGDPDEPGEPDHGQSDEDRVEPPHAVLGDPEDYLSF
jgi:hypothetical protein